MSTLSPLDPQELRDIFEALDAGNTAEAAAGLAALAEQPGHTLAVDFLAIRILFQRGRIDSEGAQARLTEILRGATGFPEAESWLQQLLTPTSDKGGVRGVDSARVDSARVDSARVDSGAAALADDAPHAGLSATPAFSILQKGDEEKSCAPSAEVAVTALLPRSPLPPAPSPAEQEQPFKAAPFDSLNAKKQLAPTAGRYRTGLSQTPPVVAVEQGSHENPGQEKQEQWGQERWEFEIDEALLDLEEGQIQRTNTLLRGLGDKRLGAPYDSRIARLFLLTGRSSEACSRAKLAWGSQPSCTEAQWSYAWCLVRQSRQESSRESLERARELLAGLSRNGCSEPGLLEALGACVEANLGSASVALQLAQRALRLKGDSIDALAALAEGNAALGDLRRANAALGQFLLQAPNESKVFQARLKALGAGDQTPASTAARWHILENALSKGDRRAVLNGLDELAQSRRQKLGNDESHTPSDRGADAADFLRTCPIFRLFGCYEFSLNDVAVVDTCLSLLFGNDPQAVADLPQQTLLRIAADYLGETLHRAAGGTWLSQQSPAQCELQCSTHCRSVQSDMGTVNAHNLVLQRIAHGGHATLTAALSPWLVPAAESSQAAPGRPIASSSLPPDRYHRSPSVSAANLDSSPEGSRPWPAPEEISAAGRSLSESVVAVYCKRFHHHALDRTVESLPALDGFLSLVAPLGESSKLRPCFSRWLATSIGGYYAEVLRESLGGSWQTSNFEKDHVLEPESYALQINEQIAFPVQVVVEGLGGRTPLKLSSHAEELIRTAKASNFDN